MQVDLTGLGKELFCGGETETLARSQHESTSIPNFFSIFGAVFWHTLTEIKLFICQGLGVQI
jgi:hypothetical protein